MSEAIPPLPNTPSWRGGELKKKHRDNFTFYLYLSESFRRGTWIGYALLKRDNDKG
jgi:hypothetical protein